MMPHRDYNIEIIVFHLITLRFPPLKHHIEWLFGNSEQPLFALPITCINYYAEIMNFIMRTHPLHFTTSSTSFHEFIYFIELAHTAAIAEGDD